MIMMINKIIMLLYKEDFKNKLKKNKKILLLWPIITLILIFQTNNLFVNYANKFLYKKIA